MADPLTIVGIVANIIQLVDFSSKVLARLDDFQSTLGEIPEAFQHIKAELPVLQETLKQTRDKIDNGVIEDSTKAALLPAIEGCKNQVQALDNLLAEISPAVGDSRFKKTTKALRSITQDGKVERIRKTLRSYTANLTFYHAAASSTLLPLKDAKLVEIRRWLSAPDPSFNYQKACKLRQPDTGLWLLQSEIYSKWKRDALSFLWLYGIPGCGKTILSSAVTQDILHCCANDPGTVVAYFYFDFANVDKQKPEQMVRSLISQPSEQCIQMPLALEALYSSLDKGNRQPSLDALMNVLQQMLEEFPRPYLILDALDECVDQPELMGVLEQMAGWQLEKMRVLVTSRKERGIESSLAKIMAPEYMVCLQSQVVDGDIQIYVRQRLSEDKDLQKWQKDAEIRRAIETTLMEGSCGMFRWAVCQMDTLGKCRTRLALQMALKSLPKTLDETYERILCKISDEDSEYALRILQWLAFSYWPLSVNELAEVVAINVERETMFNRDEILEDPMEVLDICSSLVSVVTIEGSSSSGPFRSGDIMSPTVRLAHYSVKEYLVSKDICQGRAMRFSMQPAHCHGCIAKGAIGYLLQYEKGPFDYFQYPGFLSASGPKGYALTQYSAKYWITHTQNAEEHDNRLTSLATKLLSSGGGSYENGLRLQDPILPWNGLDFRRETGQRPKALYYASLCGLADVVSLLIEEGAEFNEQGGLYGNALHIASFQGYGKIIELLLRKGADINARGEYFGNALQAASYGGHDNIVELLLNKGADVNVQGGVFNTALQAASNQGYAKIVELLLRMGADVNARGGYLGNALQAASNGGHDKIVELLLNKGTDVNVQGGVFNTALQAASNRGRGKIVELLLRNGADVNLQGGKYGTALQAASEGGYNNIIELLLSKGANTNVQEGYFGTALQAASFEGHDRIVELLLRKGANINVQGGYYGSALQAASYGGYNDTIELLLSNGADINVQGGHYGNALQAASYIGHDKTVELLLDNGADINMPGGQYDSALLAALGGHRNTTVELLKSKGAIL